ncbi:hypothetical protein Mgra_00005721 [Meloidogyne graminicola]|uniref:Uncharacterized protein n=1 Tax=Meloidogyne graminicola TaxID=189291 RepID=A0A8S9ZNT2_9BILA|nr:hypothetical protein Mgra_00005721 [Meloidogyne graminicola]
MVKDRLQDLHKFYKLVFMFYKLMFNNIIFMFIHVLSFTNKTKCFRFIIKQLTNFKQRTFSSTNFANASIFV